MPYFIHQDIGLESVTVPSPLPPTSSGHTAGIQKTKLGPSPAAPTLSVPALLLNRNKLVTPPFPRYSCGHHVAAVSTLKYLFSSGGPAIARRIDKAGSICAARIQSFKASNLTPPQTSSEGDEIW